MSETHTLFAGGLVFDGTGSEPQPADVVIAAGRIVEVGTGLDGDEAVDCTGRSAAQLMGLDGELGTIAAGRRADLVVVDGDPLDVATLAERITSVYQDGTLVHQRELDQKE